MKPATLVIAATLAIACSSAPHNPVLDAYPGGINGRTTVDYYDVHGRTFAELRADMRRSGPKLNDSSFVGETRSPMRWTYRTHSGGTSGCSITDATVSVNAQILLPRWTPPADTEPGLAAEWNRFIAALETHEAGHKDISAKAGRDIAERLRSLTGLCADIGMRANDIVRGILDKANEQQKAYDAETRHGLTQGTGFGRGLVTSSGIVGPADRLVLLSGPRLGTVRGTLPVSLEKAWAAAPAAYEASGLKVNATDGNAHALGDSLTARSRIGDLSLGEIVDCPSATGRSADSLAVTMFVVSRLDAMPPSSATMTNTVQAFTRNANGTAVACRSLGVLERLLLAQLRAKTMPVPR